MSKSVDYLQVIPVSMFFHNLSQIIEIARLLDSRIAHVKIKEVLPPGYCCMTTIKEEIHHLLVALQNTEKRDYELRRYNKTELRVYTNDL